MTETEKAVKMIVDENVKFIKLWFVDILGMVKSITIRDRELEKAFDEGMGFDGSSVEGFARIYESDLLLKPEIGTFRILPWRENSEEKVAAFFCDIETTAGKPYHGDPRYVLKKTLARAAEKGYTFNVGPELEYFYFRNNGSPIGLTDRGGYFDLSPLDAGSDLRRETIVMAESMGIEIDYSHHEVAPSQHELDLRYGDALVTADELLTVKIITKEIARQHNLYATFMPKPLYGENGSGMHVHMSLSDKKGNVFSDSNDPDLISRTARSFAAGILAHCKEITAVCNQWVNSYKRLVPGYEAPAYVAWAKNNRSSLVRIPSLKKDKPSSARIELRSPDPACNPYLAFAVMLAAGLDGIEKKMTLGKPVEADIFQMTPEEREKRGIDQLPGSLIEAVMEMEKGDLVRRTFGEHIFEKFIMNKKIEWDEYRTRVTNYELEKYMPIL